MIQLCDSTIKVLAEDGTARHLDSEEIQAHVLQSCISCGIKDAWIAEDVALSIDFILKQIDRDGRTFTLSEINSWVIKILEEAGFGEIAAHFRRHNKSREINTNSDSASISELIVKYLGIRGEELSDTAQSVQTACKKLDIKKVSPSLILEMAKHFLTVEGDRAKLIAIPARKQGISKSPWCVSEGEIISSSSEDTKVLLDGEILTVNPVSRLFPAIKLDIRLVNLADFQSFEAPLTELAMLPYFKKLSAGINEITGTVEKRYREFLGRENCDSFPGELPLYLKFADAPVFSERYLGADWPEGAGCFREMTVFLTEMLERKANIRNIS